MQAVNATMGNFAQRWFELDPAYPVIALLGRLKIIQLERGEHRGPPDRPGRVEALTRKEAVRFGLTPSCG